MSAKTVAQKRGDDVRRAADKLKKMRENLMKKNIPDTVRLNQVGAIYKNAFGKMDFQLDLDNLAVWLKENAQQFAKWSGVGMLWMSEYITRGLNYLLVDNVIIRNTEQATKNKGSTKFTTMHPWVESYLMYYMVFASMMFAGGHVVSNQISSNSEDEKEIVEKKQEQGPFGIRTTVKSKTINPSDADFVKKSLTEYWPYIAVGLTELETYREKSVLQIGESRETNGLGLTWHYIYDNNAVLHKHPNTPGKTKQWTHDYNYQQVQRHLIYETLPKLKNAIKDKKNIYAQQAIAILMAGYQRPSDMVSIADAVSNATSSQEIADAFQYYPGVKKWRDGTMKRRWWCAAFAVGAISAQDFFDLPRDAFSSITLAQVYQDGHFIINEQTVQYALKQAKIYGKSSTVKSFLSQFAEGKSVLDFVQQDKIDVPAKTISFNSAIRQIRQKNTKNARRDVLLYGTEYSGNLT